MFDGAAAPLPERRLPQRLRHTLRFDCRLSLEERPKQLDRSGDQPAGRKTAPPPGESRIRLQGQERVQVFLRLVPLWPAAIHGRTREREHFNANDPHESPSSLLRGQLYWGQAPFRSDSS